MEEESQKELFTVSTIPYYSALVDMKKKQIKVSSQEAAPLPNRIAFSRRYFLGFTNALYYTGFLPFRLRQSSGAKVECQRNLLQTVICFCFHVILTCATGSIIYFNLIEHTSLLTLHKATLTIAEPMATFYYMYTVWCHSHRFEWLLNGFDSLSPSSTSISGSVSPKMGIQILRPYSFFETIENWSAVICSVLPILVNFQVWNLIFNYNFGHFNPSWDYDSEGGGWLLTIGMRTVYLILSYGFIMTIHMANIIFHGVALTFRDGARGFIHMLANQDGNEMDNNADHLLIMEKYLELEEFMDGVNGRFGGWVLIRVTFTIPYFSEKLIELLKGEGTASSNLLTVLYTFSVIFWLLSAANVSSRICDGMKNWMKRNGNYDKLSCKQLTMMTSKLTPDTIAMRAGNFFAVTYPFIGTLVSLVITWAFIDNKT